MTTAILETPTVIREDDIQQHIEDTQLFWVTRNNRALKVAWNEMSEQEREWQIEAERRDYFCTLHNIY